jgi:hypothetical protein
VEGGSKGRGGEREKSGGERREGCVPFNFQTVIALLQSGDPNFVTPTFVALMKITGRYGNRDQRQDGSVHRKSAQIADDVTD